MDEINQEHAKHAQRVNSEGSSSVEREEKRVPIQSGTLQREHQHQAGMDEEHQDAHLAQMPLEFCMVTSAELKQMRRKYTHHRYCAEYV